MRLYKPIGSTAGGLAPSGGIGFGVDHSVVEDQFDSVVEVEVDSVVVDEVEVEVDSDV